MPYTSLLLQVSSVVNELGLRARGSIGDATERPSLERHGRSVTSARTTQCKWWSWPGSNRRPPGCKPGALPAELQPRGMVGLSGFEPLTSRLSAVRSSQLSYRPVVSTRTEPALVGFCTALPKSDKASAGGCLGGSLKTR
jgi:hypothetical protein